MKTKDILEYRGINFKASTWQKVESLCINPKYSKDGIVESLVLYALNNLARIKQESNKPTVGYK